MQNENFQMTDIRLNSLATLDNASDEDLQRTGRELIPGKDINLDEDAATLILTQIVSNFAVRMKNAGAAFQLLVNKESLLSEVILCTDDHRQKDRVEISPREVWLLAVDCECSVLTAAANLTAVLVADYVMEDIRRRSMPLWLEEIEPEVEECVRSAVMRRTHTELLPEW